MSILYYVKVLIGQVFPHFACRTSVALLAVFIQCPAFLTSCAKADSFTPRHNGRQIYIQWAKNPTPEAIDLFFFDTTGTCALDSYQQVLDWDGSEAVYGLSGSGAKRLVALSGKADDTPLWAHIRTYGDLCQQVFSLAQDGPSQPLLCGEALLDDVLSGQTVLRLHSSLSRIVLRSLSCDFRDRPYAAASFMCNSVYLQYAGSECMPLGSTGIPIAWMNPGPLDSAAVAQLPHPEMLMQKGCGSVGPERLYPEMEFCCYANPVTEASLGSPVTRIVLCGSVDGVECYYPIELPGLQADVSYYLDVSLFLMGSPDPDIPVRSGTVKLEMQVIPWNEYKPYTVLF